MLQDQGDLTLPGVSSTNPSFSKAGAIFGVSMPGHSGDSALSLGPLTGPYNPSSHSEWPQSNRSQAGYPTTCTKQEPLSISIQEPTLSLQTTTSSLLQHPPLYRTEKTDFHPSKQEQKGAGGGSVGKHQPPQQSAYPPSAPPLQRSPAQKLSLDKYREKHAAELSVSGQKRSQEQHGGVMDSDLRGDMSSSYSTYAPSTTSQVEHRKHSQPHQTSHGTGGTSTASPIKMKVPSSSSSQDRRHHNEKRDKGSLKLRLAVPGGSSQLDKSGHASKDELKMKIKVSSSERHSSSDEGMGANNKSKHSSPLVNKEKQPRGADHSLQRHHKHSHSHSHSGNGRGGPEGPGGGGGLLRGPPGLVSMDGASHAPSGSTSLPSSSSRRRAHPDASQNHHSSSSFSSSCSKMSKISKGGTGAAGTTTLSLPFLPPCSSPVLQCVSSGLQLYG